MNHSSVTTTHSLAATDHSSATATHFSSAAAPSSTASAQFSATAAHHSPAYAAFVLYQGLQQAVETCTERELLSLAERYGFSGQIWHSFLALQLVLDENPFSLACERREAANTSLAQLARAELRQIRTQFFSAPPKRFSPAVLQLLADYTPTNCLYDAAKFVCDEQVPHSAHPAHDAQLSHRAQQVFLTAGKQLQALGAALAAAPDDAAFFDCLTAFYQKYGVGLFACCPAFELTDALNLLNSQTQRLWEAPVPPGQALSLLPIGSLDTVSLSDLLGYEYQKERLKANTSAFCAGLPSNNVLLYGDSGTGKSTCIRALINAFWEKGLRLIEVRRHQFQVLPALIALLRRRNYRFLLYLDDLSFEEFETEYKYLKAVIEGGAEPRPENVLIYATSNRRHLIREQLADRSDMEHGEDVHRSDTMEEKQSLASRFGLALCFARPDRQRFYDMVLHLARRSGISETQLSDEALLLEANQFSMRGGGLSGRTAQQFVDFLLSGTGSLKPAQHA